MFWVRNENRTHDFRGKRRLLRRLHDGSPKTQWFMLLLINIICMCIYIYKHDNLTLILVARKPKMNPGDSFKFGCLWTRTYGQFVLRTRAIVIVFEKHTRVILSKIALEITYTWNARISPHPRKKPIHRIQYIFEYVGNIFWSIIYDSTARTQLLTEMLTLQERPATFVNFVPPYA